MSETTTKTTANVTTTTAETTPSARTLANRANALKSTGPKSEAGKQRVSMNAFKHGLCGQKLMLQADEYIPYFSLAAKLVTEYRPVGAREEQLVQHAIDSNWRLCRCAAIENNLMGAGTLEEDAKDLVKGDDADLVAMVGQSLAWKSNAKAFEALSRHQTRIARFMRQTEQQLDELQAKRIRKADNQDVFEAETSDAWSFYNDSLAHHLTLLEREAKELEAAEAADEPEPHENTATSALALKNPAAAPPTPSPAEQRTQLLAALREFVVENLPGELQSALNGPQTAKI